MNGGWHFYYVLARSAEKIRDNNIAGSNIYTVAASWGQLLAFVVIGLLIVSQGNLSSGHHAHPGLASCLLLSWSVLSEVINNTTPQIGRAKVS